MYNLYLYNHLLLNKIQLWQKTKNALHVIIIPQQKLAQSELLMFHSSKRNISIYINLSNNKINENSALTKNSPTLDKAYSIIVQRGPVRHLERIWKRHLKIKWSA